MCYALLFQATQFLTQIQNAHGVKGFGTMTNTTIGAGLLASITGFMAELVLLYRCWVLWSKNYWIILFPALVVTGNLGK